MRRIWKLCVVFGAILGLAACGDDGNGGASSDAGVADNNGGGADLVNWPQLPAATVVVQDHWTAQQIAGDAGSGCLKDGLTQLGQQGFGDFVAAGQTLGSAGLDVIWQAVSNGSGAERYALKLCAEGDCWCAKVQLSNGKPTIEPVSGSNTQLPVIGAPVMAKTLANAELSAQTTLTTAAVSLLTAPLPDPKPENFIGKRRFVAISAFGNVHGVDFDGVSAPADDSGAFTDVIEHPYIQATELDTYLEDLHAQDVLFWFGSTVLAEKGAGKHKPEGMTVNRAIYGDQTYDRQRIEAHLSRAPLGGPGLVILAGAESFGTVADGLTPYGSVENLVRSLGKRPRVVVGVRGMADAGSILRSGRVLVEKLTAGESLKDAMAAATGEFSASGQDASWETNLDPKDAEVFRLGPSPDTFWGTAKPTSGKFVGYVFIGPATQCTDKITNATYHPEAAASHPLIADITINGPFFQGQRDDDEGKFSVFGVVESLRQGGAVKYWLKGSKGTVVSDILLFADGYFCGEGQCNGKVTGPNDFKAEGIEMYFSGTAESSEFTNEKGDQCKPSGMALTQGSGGPSWLIVGP